jgi:glycosyltransferase 2 family protein
MTSPAPQPTTPRWRPVLFGIARFALVLLPLLWLSQHVDLTGVAAGFRQVGIARIALCFAVQLGALGLVSLRWRTLLASYGAEPRPRVSELVRANFVANYFSLVPVPGADEGVRVLRTKHFFPRDRVLPYLVIAVERLCGVTGLLLLAALAALITRGTVSSASLHGFALGSAFALFLALLVLGLPVLLRARPALQPLVARLPLVGPILVQLPPPVRRFRLLACVALSLLSHFISAVLAALLFAPLDAQATFPVCARVQPLVLLAMAVPLTPSGIGQREVAFATLYGLAGVAPASAVTVSLLSWALLMAQTLVGGVVYAVERFLRRDDRGPRTHGT